MPNWLSSKKNMNAKNSTEAELIRTSKYVPFNVWMVIILEEQGYDIKKNIIFQDNQSTIRMSKNGRAYCWINFRHINIRHFFLKDRADRGEIDVNYYLNHLMIADYFAKPLQGKMLKMFCDLIMVYVHINDILQEIELSAKEWADKSRNMTIYSIIKNWKNLCWRLHSLKKEGRKRIKNKNILKQNI